MRRNKVKSFVVVRTSSGHKGNIVETDVGGETPFQCMWALVREACMRIQSYSVLLG